MAWSWMLAYLPLDLAVTALAFFLVPKLKQALRRTHHLNTEM
jgi:biotin transport system substrate-specific component